MGNLVVCCDGTCDSPDQKDEGQTCPSNVWQLKCILDEKDSNGNLQPEPKYLDGVGVSELDLTGEALGTACQRKSKRHTSGLARNTSQVIIYVFSVLAVAHSLSAALSE